MRLVLDACYRESVVCNRARLRSSRPFGERREPTSPEARERSFDELAIGLSSGSLSRGKALRLMGAALIGGTLASIPGVVEAAPLTCPPGRPVKCRHAFNGEQCCQPDYVCCSYFSPGVGRRVKNCVFTAETCTNFLGGRVTRS